MATTVKPQRSIKRRLKKRRKASAVRRQANPSPRRRASTSRGVKQTIVARWGNSLALRIPREGVKELGVHEGETVDLVMGNRQITIRLSKPHNEWTEDQMLQGVTPDMVGGEFDGWGDPVGKEIF